MSTKEKIKITIVSIFLSITLASLIRIFYLNNKIDKFGISNTKSQQELSYLCKKLYFRYYPYKNGDSKIFQEIRKMCIKQKLKFI